MSPWRWTWSSWRRERNALGRAFLLFHKRYSCWCNLYLIVWLVSASRHGILFNFFFFLPFFSRLKRMKSWRSERRDLAPWQAQVQPLLLMLRFVFCTLLSAFHFVSQFLHFIIQLYCSSYLQKTCGKGVWGSKTLFFLSSFFYRQRKRSVLRDLQLHDFFSFFSFFTLESRDSLTSNDVVLGLSAHCFTFLFNL